MALSRDAKKSYKKAVKAKNKRRKKHWLFIRKGDGIKEVISKLFTQFAVLVLVGCAVVMGNELRLSISAKLLNSSLKDLYYSYIAPIGGQSSDDERAEPLDSAKELLKINPDTVGWIHIEGTEISLPIVQRAKNEGGNDHYLKTAFDGSTNKAGTIFLDWRNTLTANRRSDNLVVYGHNQKDGTMFGDLANYKKDLEYYKAHPVVSLSSNYGTDIYKIFACFVTAVEPYQSRDGYIFGYHNYVNFQNEAEYSEFISNVMLRSQIITTVDTQHGDSFLTLSTCSNEFEPSRFVVFARKTRDGEGIEVDVENAYVNPNALEPDWDFIYS